MIRSYKVIHSGSSGVLGIISLNDGPAKAMNGWWFISKVSAHKGGRKAWATPELALPGWAKKMGVELTFDGDEMDKRARFIANTL